MEENKAYLKPNQELHFKKTYKINPDEAIMIEGDNLYDFVKKLQQENAELKERKDKYYQRTLDLEIVVSEYRQALEEIRKLINETCWDYTDISIIPVKEKMLEVINEVLEND